MKHWIYYVEIVPVQINYNFESLMFHIFELGV